MDDIDDTIGLLPQFAGCSRHERELVGRLSTVTEVPRGSVLCHSGQPGANLYVLVDGEALVTVDERLVAVLGRGCGFGEIARSPSSPSTRGSGCASIGSSRTCPRTGDPPPQMANGWPMTVPASLRTSSSAT